MLNHKHIHQPKPYLTWEQAELQSGGLYARNMEVLTKKFPDLTPMELRVCALVKAMLSSREIASILSIDERTVENHRTNARRKMKIRSRKPLIHYLTML
jgi:DNA-binding CsgD family transcriptional regulator